MAIKIPIVCVVLEGGPGTLHVSPVGPQTLPTPLLWLPTALQHPLTAGSLDRLVKPQLPSVLLAGQ